MFKFIRVLTYMNSIPLRAPATALFILLSAYGYVDTFYFEDSKSRAVLKTCIKVFV